VSLGLYEDAVSHAPDIRPVLEVRDVSRTYRHGGQTRTVLIGVSFDLWPGHTIAVVGESGAGKTTLARLIAGLDRPNTGSILIGGKPLRLRSGFPSPVQMVFQDPRDALNPYLSVGHSVGEPLRRLRRDERRNRVAELLQLVGLDPTRHGQKPAMFSGGQQQRLVLARALAAAPKLLICDEPTSSLDVSVQAQIINLILQLQASLGFACLVVTHDLSVVRILADDVMVLRSGVMLEHTDALRFFEMPAAEYSRSLLDAAKRQALHRT